MKSFYYLALAWCILALWPATLPAQNLPCNFSLSSPGPVLTRDFDATAPPYQQQIFVGSVAFGDLIDVTSTNVSITICFWGDMDETTETFNVNIAGVNTTINLGVPTTQGAPVCRNFLIPAANAEIDMADGDIDITYNTFGSGWTSVDSTSPPDVFNAQVVATDFQYVIPVTISDPSDRCQDAADMTFTATPVDGTQAGDMVEFNIYPPTASFTFNNSTATLDVSATPPGEYRVEYVYTVNGCTFTVDTAIVIWPIPRASLTDRLLDCYPVGDTLNLSVMYNGANTGGGTWTTTPAGPTASGDLAIPATSSCYTVVYEALNLNNCPNAPYRDTATLLITPRVTPAFTISGATSPVCQDGGTVDVTITRTSTGPNPSLTINGVAASFGLNQLPAPVNAGSITYKICLSETNSAPPACDTLPGMNYTPCTDTVCRFFTVYNDGSGCGANAPFADQCPPNEDLHDPCPVYTQPDLEIDCVFEVTFGKIAEAELEPQSGVIFCSDDSVCVNWQGSLAGPLGDLLTDSDETLSSIGGDFTEAVCDIITYEFCIPIPFIRDPCIDPVPLPGFIEDACDQTIGQFILSALGEAIGGEAGGGLLVADTDGDGAFDMVLEEYVFPDNGTSCIPNNITTPTGTITVRNVTAWPFTPESACGAITAEEINLLDVLPIGAIPLIGEPVEDFLEAAGCSVNMVFSDEETIEIPVINNQRPVFANCNESGYVFSEDLICDTEANWSVPVAYDGCFGNTLSYQGYTQGADLSFYSGAAATPVSVTGPGVYQIGGPIIGSELPPGTYTVTYVAYSCAGVSDTCSFPVVVTAGDPVLACPNNVTVRTDADQCDAIVTGISPLQGLGCATIINYSVLFPDSSLAESDTPFTVDSLGTHNDPSGLTFPQGVSTVTYTMLVDIDGDGNTNGPNEEQTCSFTVTVLDAQRPIALCQDIEVQLNNTGQVTVYAENQNNGSPFLDGGASDNCDPDPLVEIALPGGAFGPSVTFDCDNTGNNYVNVRAMDNDGNFRICLANVHVVDFFENIQLALDVPELCLEATNPVQLNFANYLNVTLPNGTIVSHSQVASNNFLGDAQGFFGITAFVPHPGSASNDPGTITTDGVYTPGTGTGYVTVSYALALPGAVPQNGNNALSSCFVIVHETFELRQPLTMDTTECECYDNQVRVVDLGTLTGGLEPYTIQYSGAQLDVNGDGTIDDTDGEYTYEGVGVDINNFQQDLGQLFVSYTVPTWSFTIVDARGCEIFRAGSCDTDDLTESPTIPCTGAASLFTEPFNCEAQYSWQHAVPDDNCAVRLYDYRIINPDGTIDGPHNLDALLFTLPNTPPAGLFEAEYEFQLGTSTVQYYAEDAVGNSVTCSFSVTVSDDDPPYFINCPYPPVIQDAEPNVCDAYVNFALPLAADNCSMPPVTQIDQTGLHTGSRFPVGTTVLYYEAVDPAGNRDTCQVKVIVNDFGRIPQITCPANVVQNNDPGICGATVNNLKPTIAGPCVNNFAVTYSIFSDPALTQRIDCGVWDASGTLFDVATTYVRYTVHNQPLLLISEVQQSGAVDRIEITNLGPAAIDITCLLINRSSLLNPLANQTIGPVTILPSLAGTILPVGGVLSYNFGFNAPANLPACYTISYMGVTIDEVAVNGALGCSVFNGNLASGDVFRTCEDDSNTAADWAVATPCAPLAIGTPNADLKAMPFNGTTTSLQSIPPYRATCTISVTVNDVEKPWCGELAPNSQTYNGPGITGIAAVACNRSTITVPAQNCLIGNISLTINGTATPANSTITLLTPHGLKIPITSLPANILPILFARPAPGAWTLDVVPNPGQSVTLNGWSLTITCLRPFDEPNHVLNNDPDQCGANFTWTHPYFVDNCLNGTISVAYTTTNAACTPVNGVLPGRGGNTTTQFFCVGTTVITYTLTDAAGNTQTCGFSVTVNDVQKPVVVCPQDITVQLTGGECGAFVNYAPLLAADNCAVVDTVGNPPSGTWFDIGTHTVTITVFDAAGNSTLCSFEVNILEFIPTSNQLTCNNLENVSLDSTCIFTLSADFALEGNNYRCYDNYLISIKNAAGVPVGNTFTAAHIGQLFTVTVTDPVTGNSCWTTMRIQDKLAPNVTCPPDVTIQCTQDEDSPAITGLPTWTDCTNVTTFRSDDVQQFTCTENSVVTAVFTRTWTARDAWNNTSTCTQTITQNRGELGQISFPADIDLSCTAVPGDLTPNISGWPKIGGANLTTSGSGFCGLGLSYSDEVQTICPGSYKTIRTWHVTDWCPAGGTGPTSVTHVQYIKVQDEPPSIDFSNFAFDSLNNCYLLSTNTSFNGQCVATGYLPAAIISGVCNDIFEIEVNTTIGIAANGGLIPAPGLPEGQYPITYIVRDECGNFTQKTITLCVVDNVPPVVSCDEHTQVALGVNGMALINATTFDDGSYDNCAPIEFKARRMNPNDCQSDSVFVDQVKFCCSDIGDTITVVLRVYDVDVPVGMVPTDAFAGKYNDCMVQVYVEDKLKPTCAAPANVTVSCQNFDETLWGYGLPTLADNCCLDSARVYQNQPGLEHSVNYANFDTVCNKGTLVRTFRVFDCGGNSSSCTQSVVVNYVQDYYVRFPNDVLVTFCDSSGVYGQPQFFGEDCELLSTSFSDEIFTLVPDACFKIERTWHVINWCQYNPNLPLTYVPNPNPSAGTLDAANLAGVTVSACGTPAPWAPSVVKVTPTDPLATNYCQFWSANTNGYEYKQIIKIIDLQEPVALNCPDSTVAYCDYTVNDPSLWNETYWYDATLDQHDLCEGPADLSVTATDFCSGADIDVSYQLFLDLDGDGTMETVVNSNQPQPAGEVLYGNAADPNFLIGTLRSFDGRPVPPSAKYRFALETSTAGDNLTARVRWNTQSQPNTFVPAELPYGTHKIKWFIGDKCGNETVCEYNFTVEDCKKPTAVCLNGLAVNIMPTGMIQLWAADFLLYGDDNCTPANQLAFGVRAVGTGSGFPLNAQGQPQTAVTFDCSQLGTQFVEVWALDAAGNADYCETYVIVQDNMGVCGPQGPAATVAGVLATETQDGVEEVQVQLTGTHPALPPVSALGMSDAFGSYGFVQALPFAGNYVLTPVKDDNPLNGVSTFDLVKISRHILGLEPLNTPYKLIAADANKSNSITTFDIVELRKLILGIYTELPANNSWRFVDKAFVFLNAQNPFQLPFPETIAAADVQGNMFLNNFVGVKIGDVNGTALPNSLSAADDRTTSTLYFDLEDRTVTAGDEFDVTLTAAAAVQAYQFTLNTAGLDVEYIASGTPGMTAEHFAVFNAENAVTTSFGTAEGEAPTGTFTLHLRASRSGRLSELLGISSRITRAEAYDANGAKMDVALRFASADPSQGGASIKGVGFELYQNVPNPFERKTQIGFHLPEDTRAVLTVYDETGRQLYQLAADYVRGYHIVPLDLPTASGTLYYRLEAGKHQGVRKMNQVR